MQDKVRKGIARRTSFAPPDEPVSGVFRLYLLGPFSLSGPGGEAIEIGSKKNRLLLAMVASAQGRSMSRDALSGLLWAGHSDEQAKNSLRQALAVLRKELKGQDGAFFAGLDGAVTLHPDRVAIDADFFLKDVGLATRSSLERSIALWRGPFLADVSAPEPEIEQWLSERREYFNSRYIAAMDRLVPLLDGAARINMASRLVQTDTLREGSHRQLMEAYLASGEKAQALRHYDKLRKLLREELAVEPSPATQMLRDRIAATGNSVSPAALPDIAVGVPELTSASQATAVQLVVRASGNLFAALTAAVVLLALSLGGWMFARPAPMPVTRPSIAILPFESLSGSVEDARIATGLTIDTISDLSRYADFRVMAKDTTDAYKGKAVDIRELGKDLKVSHVLKGTFQRDKEHVRITAQLIDSATGETLWSDRYDRLIGQIFAVQSDVADHIANSLGGREGKVGASMLGWARRKPPVDLGAYELYLLAQETMYSDLSSERMKEGQKILEQAIAKDPAFARAYVRYANAFAWRATSEAGAGELFQQMVLYARKAVSLDPMDADAHAALGYALTLTGDLKQGESHLDEALRLTPNAFDILIFHACLDHAYGKVEKGMEAVDRAITINPAYPKWAVPCLRLGAVLVGRHEDAIRIQSRQPENEMNTDGYVVLAGSLASLGRMDEATVLVKRGVARFPGLLSIERFALNRYWGPYSSKVMVELMRKAGFPTCATAQELADTPDPVRLPECVG
jgi:TolB-like protein/DNA-binding SARP family transcriptional activator/Flp pilus assembly protein TadD